MNLEIKPARKASPAPVVSTIFFELGVLVIEWPELIETVINNFWKIKISYAKNYGRHYDIWAPKNLLTFS